MTKIVAQICFFGILSIIQKKVLNHIKDLKFYNILIDESNDISITAHLVIFNMFVKEGILRCVFSGPLHVDVGKKDA